MNNFVSHGQRSASQTTESFCKHPHWPLRHSEITVLNEVSKLKEFILTDLSVSTENDVLSRITASLS